MIENVVSVDQLRALARRMSKPHEYHTVAIKEAESYVEDGWETCRLSKRTARLRKPKGRGTLLENRVWTLLYRMGFPLLSAHGGAHLSGGPDDAHGVANQLDVVGLDDEVALAIECKSAVARRKPVDFQKDLAKLSVLKQSFANSVHAAFPLDEKDNKRRRVPVLVFFTWDLILSKSDRERARSQQIVLLEEQDLEYYEELVTHLGPAAKYQFFADLLPHKAIHGLRVSVPALRARMGDKYTCYTFSVKPGYLLKIAYVSHRAKGHAKDVDTYQRMIRKSRLRSIRKYITENGMFPTNIVISLDGKGITNFDPHAKDSGPEGAEYGTLHLNPAYKSAWIIDGQHRLFAYSGHPRASTSYVNVLAFDHLPASEQAQLFIDINHEQKSVKRGLLQELYAELHWNSDDDETRLRAIVSKAVQALGAESDSPFYGRIQLADDKRSHTRCISLGTLFSALMQGHLFIVHVGKEFGPLWAVSNEATVDRATTVVKAWFNAIAARASEWWNLGAGEGGGLAMNDGVTACLAVMRSVMEHLQGRNVNLIRLSDIELVEILEPYAEALGAYLGTLGLDEREGFRTLRGVQGQTARRIMCQKALHARLPEFDPPGLAEALAAEESNAKQQAYAVLEQVERKLHQMVLEMVKEEYGTADEAWWYSGVPDGVRKKVVLRVEEDQGRKGPKEGYFDLLDFKDIASKNWNLFREVLGKGSGSKDRQLHWIDDLNEVRKVVMHASKNISVSPSELAQLEKLEEWLDGRLQLLDEVDDNLDLEGS